MFAESEDANVVAGLLKLWLREYPDPLLTKDLYDMFICAATFKEEKIIMAKLQQVLEFLPVANLKILTVLFKLLKTVHEMSAVNKMHSDNLAIVFAPNILQPKAEKMEDIVGLSIEDGPRANKLVSMLIVNYDKIFSVPSISPFFLLEIIIFFFLLQLERL